MRVVLIGATAFTARCLEAILTERTVELVGVVTAPQKFSISYRPEGVTNVRHSDLTTRCAALDLPSVVIKGGMRDPDLETRVEAWRPDIFLVAGWYHIVPRRWRDVAPAFGLHASLLPAYRGGAPLVWAMIQGESTTGITLFQLDDGVDTGPIVGQRVVEIAESDTIGTLYERVEAKGVDLILEHLPNLAAGDALLVPQPAGDWEVWPQRGPEDGWIDWTTDARSVERFIRAQTHPYPGAFTTLGDSLIRIWRAEAEAEGVTGRQPGLVRRSSDGYLVSCGRGELRLLEASRPDGIKRTGPKLEELFGKEEEQRLFGITRNAI